MGGEERCVTASWTPSSDKPFSDNNNQDINVSIPITYTISAAGTEQSTITPLLSPGSKCNLRTCIGQGTIKDPTASRCPHCNNSIPCYACHPERAQIELPVNKTKCNVAVCFPSSPQTTGSCPHCSKVGAPCYNCHPELDKHMDCDKCGQKGVRLVHDCRSPSISLRKPCDIKVCGTPNWKSLCPHCGRIGGLPCTRCHPELITCTGGSCNISHSGPEEQAKCEDCRHPPPLKPCSACDIVGAPKTHVCQPLPPACPDCGTTENVRFRNSNCDEIYCQNCTWWVEHKSDMIPRNIKFTATCAKCGSQSSDTFLCRNCYPSPPPPPPPQPCPFVHENWDEAKKCPLQHPPCAHCGATNGHVRLPNISGPICDKCFKSTPHTPESDSKAPIPNGNHGQVYGGGKAVYLKHPGGGYIWVPLDSLPVPQPKEEGKWVINENGTVSFLPTSPSVHADYGSDYVTLLNRAGTVVHIPYPRLPHPTPGQSGKWKCASNGQLFYEADLSQIIIDHPNPIPPDWVPPRKPDESGQWVRTGTGGLFYITDDEIMQAMKKAEGSSLSAPPPALAPVSTPRLSIKHNRKEGTIQLVDPKQFAGVRRRPPPITLDVPQVGPVKFMWGAFATVGYLTQYHPGEEDRREWHIPFNPDATPGSLKDATHFGDAHASLHYFNQALATIHDIFYANHPPQDENNNNEEILE